MTKTIKTIVSVILSMVMCLSCTVFSFAAEDKTTAEPLRFGDDGKLRIMHLTDGHLDYNNVDETVWLIGNACDREQPDVIMLTGDVALDGDKEERLYVIDKIMTVFQTREIPVAFTHGNHDSEGGIFTREEVVALYNQYDCSITVDDGDALPRCGTYNVPVLASDSDEMKFNLWVFDSGSSNNMGYENVTAEQVEWYVEKSKAIEEANGKKINSLVFQHIIVPEIYDCLERVDEKAPFTYEHIYNKGEFYRFSTEFENHGVLNEAPCPGYYNHGQFDAMVERGDVLGMFTGHDHSNAFSVKYKGINITNSLSTRYNGDMYTTRYGYRIIDIDENDTSTYETRVEHWYDIYDCDTIRSLRKAGDSYGYWLAQKVRFCGFFEKAYERVSIFTVQLFTGRTVDYK